MTPKQNKHMNENAEAFVKRYCPKYVNGQESHGGNMFEMGAYQALENAEEECLDNWSYLRQIRKTIDEIDAELFPVEGDEKGTLERIDLILNRVKND